MQLTSLLPVSCYLHEVLSFPGGNFGSNCLVLQSMQVLVYRDLCATRAPAEDRYVDFTTFLDTCVAAFSCLK